jgi:hypothetical protein
LKNRHLISAVLFIIAVLLLLGFGAVRGQWTTGVLLGLVFAVAGIFFYRRGK